MLHFVILIIIIIIFFFFHRRKRYSIGMGEDGQQVKKIYRASSSKKGLSTSGSCKRQLFSSIVVAVVVVFSFVCVCVFSTHNVLLFFYVCVCVCLFVLRAGFCCCCSSWRNQICSFSTRFLFPTSPPPPLSAEYEKAKEHRLSLAV